MGRSHYGIVPRCCRRKKRAYRQLHLPHRRIDCDGLPLANRTVSLTQVPYNGSIIPGSVNGSFGTATATTDNNGVANCTFIAGNQPGQAILNAHCLYTTPQGCLQAVTAGVTIAVGPVAKAYIIRASVAETRTMEKNYWASMPLAYPNRLSEFFSYKQTVSVNASAICSNELGAQDNVVDMSSEYCAISGNTSTSSHTTKADQATFPVTGLVEERSIINSSENGIPVAVSTEGNSTLGFTYDPADPAAWSFGIGAVFLVRRQSYHWHHKTDRGTTISTSDTTEFEPYNYAYSVPLYGKRTMAIVDSGFAVNYTLDSSWTESESTLPGCSFCMPSETRHTRSTRIRTPQRRGNSYVNNSTTDEIEYFDIRGRKVTGAFRGIMIGYGTRSAPGRKTTGAQLLVNIR